MGERVYPTEYFPYSLYNISAGATYNTMVSIGLGEQSINDLEAQK